MFSFSIIKYITGETTLKPGTDTTVTPDKALMEKEKELLDQLKVRKEKHQH
jgi:hypothetical protein